MSHLSLFTRKSSRFNSAALARRSISLVSKNEAIAKYASVISGAIQKICEKAEYPLTATFPCVKYATTGTAASCIQCFKQAARKYLSWRTSRKCVARAGWFSMAILFITAFLVPENNFGLSVFAMVSILLLVDVLTVFFTILRMKDKAA